MFKALRFMPFRRRVYVYRLSHPRSVPSIFCCAPGRPLPENGLAAHSLVLRARFEVISREARIRSLRLLLTGCDGRAIAADCVDLRAVGGAAGWYGTN